MKAIFLSDYRGVVTNEQYYRAGEEVDLPNSVATTLDARGIVRVGDPRPSRVEKKRPATESSDAFVPGPAEEAGAWVAEYGAEYYATLKKAELSALCKARGLPSASGKNKAEIIRRLLDDEIEPEVTAGAAPNTQTGKEGAA